MTASRSNYVSWQSQFSRHENDPVYKKDKIQEALEFFICFWSPTKSLGTNHKKGDQFTFSTPCRG
jgi:hypothetical protein